MNIIGKIRSLFLKSDNQHLTNKVEQKKTYESIDIIVDTFNFLISIPDDENSWEAICDRSENFLITDDFIDLSWNRLADKYGFNHISENMISENEVELSYRKSSIKYQLNHDRDDIIRAYCALSKLLEDDFYLFYCTDSWQTSDLAFLAVPSSHIDSLNDNESKKIIPVQENFDIFFNNAFSDEYKNNYT
ncbi:hypothetical protein [Teredinibacter waterburyi]|uniref:hypothetical protein n=1 Tax=Teredinibacter waterburyi TaxID=1500538 RepID=UPI00165F8F83|nr:hypothetical protein [Teredinibacter waterburyi]